MRAGPPLGPAAALIALAALAGCASAPIAAPADPSSPTGGLSLQVWVARTDTRQYQFFRVAADGSLSYGGAMRAFDRQFEWEGRLSDDEARTLRAIVDRAGWLTAEDPERPGARTPVAEVVVGNGRRDRSFTITGPDAAVDEVESLLGKAAARRFDRYMQRLPEAGPRVR